jgi:excisionase family DNA binding protein
MADIDLLSTAEVAELTGWSVNSIHRRVDDGTLPVARKLPGRTGAFLFHRGDVEKYLPPRAQVSA